ncbi:MAG TPA: hypothetical protein VLS48_00835, partial [Anaerolineales bacterium]|nr:hypothetical protein [Anaerolineales bacterium]
GLASFVLRMRQTTPISMHEISEQNVSSAWDAAPLSGINTLADFALVLVITESPDTARVWVEQVGPALGDTPLLLAVSAQAEPLVRPYAGAGANQVQGLISSISGGVYYDYLQFRRQPGVVWSAYSLGAWAAVVLILLGGLINLIVGSVAGRRTRPAAAQTPPASSAGGVQEEKP